MAAAPTDMARNAAIDQALRAAREAEAAHYQARLGFHQAKLLRLSALSETLAPVFAATAPGLASPDLASSLAADPRLWVDLVTSVVMEPDPRTYRLIRDAEAGPEVLCETPDPATLGAAVRSYLVHRQVAIARQTQPVAPLSTVASPAAAPWVIAIAAFAAGAAIATVASMLLK